MNAALNLRIPKAMELVKQRIVRRTLYRKKNNLEFNLLGVTGLRVQHNLSDILFYNFLLIASFFQGVVFLPSSLIGRPRT